MDRHTLVKILPWPNFVASGKKDRKLEVEALLHFTRCAVNANSLLTLSSGKDKRKISLSGLL